MRLERGTMMTEESDGVDSGNHDHDLSPGARGEDDCMWRTRKREISLTATEGQSAERRGNWTTRSLSRLAESVGGQRRRI